MKCFIAFVLGFLASGVAWARLGETETQLLNRYGETVMRAPELVVEQGRIYTLAYNLHFRVDDWTVIARMVNGRCESISYGKPGEWTEDQYHLVLEANGKHAQWEERKTATPKNGREWKRRDGATAVWQPSSGITFESPAYPKARAALKKRAKEEEARRKF